MATTKLNAGQVREDTLTDADNDTLIQVEESSDEDKIRFDTAGTERMIILNDGAVGIGTTTPDNLLTVVGGHVSSDGGVRTGTHHFSWSDRTASFAAGTADLVSYISFGNNSVWGWVEVTLTDAYSSAQTTGKYTKRYQIGRNIDGAVNHQSSEVPANIGSVVDEWNLGPFEVDSNDLRIPIHRVSTSQNSVTVFVEGQLHVAGLDTVDNVLNSLSLSSPAVVDNSATRDYYSIMSDRVGIGTTDPDYTLDVAGNVGFDEYIYHNGDADTYIRFEDDSINIYCGGRQMIKMVEAATDKVTINNGGQDVDVQIKGENEANLFRTDAANDLIGIKTSIPKCTLSVSGSMAVNMTALDNNYDPGTTYTIAATDYILAVNTRPTGEGGLDSAITLTLPLAADYPGRMLIIKDSAGYSDVNNIIITRAGSDTIDGLDTSVTISSPAQSKHYVSNGISIWMDITG